jgi:predicted RND superfamily exporter protein
MRKEIDLSAINEETATFDVQAIVDKVAHFQTQTVVADALKKAIEWAIKAYKQDRSIDKLKELYREKVRPTLVTRGLISPYGLYALEGVELHKAYKKYVDQEVKYMTSIDLMTKMTKMPEAY